MPDSRNSPALPAQIYDIAHLIVQFGPGAKNRGPGPTSADADGQTIAIEDVIRQCSQKGVKFLYFAWDIARPDLAFGG